MIVAKQNSLVSRKVAACLAGACLSTSAWADLTYDPGVAIGIINSDKITEGSGITVSAFNPGVFWTHNDGSRDSIYAFQMNGTLLATFKLGKNVDDIEDIANGPGPVAGAHYLYVGDIGSNDSSRDKVRILRVLEPVVDPARAQNPVSKNFKGVDVCQLKYPDGNFDAEGLLVDPVEGALYVATKQADGSRLYKFLLSKFEDGKTKDLEFVRTLPFVKVSGGAVSSDGSRIALRREDFAMGWTRAGSESVGDALGREGTPIPLIAPPTEPNGEGISFLPDGSGYVTLSEGPNQPIYFFRKTPEGGGCVDPPRLGTFQFDRDRSFLSFQGCPGSSVAIDRSTDLVHWTELGVVQINGGSGSFLDTSSPGTSFYRLRTAQ